MLYELIGFPGLAQGSQSTVGELWPSPGLGLTSLSQLQSQGLPSQASPTQPSNSIFARISL